MNRKIKDIILDKMHAQDVFCRTITFTVFSTYGTSASKFRENNE